MVIVRRASGGGSSRRGGSGGAGSTAGHIMIMVMVVVMIVVRSRATRRRCRLRHARWAMPVILVRLAFRGLGGRRLGGHEGGLAQKNVSQRFHLHFLLQRPRGVEGKCVCAWRELEERRAPSPAFIALRDAVAATQLRVGNALTPVMS